MPRPISRRELIRRLRKLGWQGPFAGKRHQHMTQTGKRIPIPNPHRGDLDWSLVSVLLRQAGIRAEEWKTLDL